MAIVLICLIVVAAVAGYWIMGAIDDFIGHGYWHPYWDEETEKKEKGDKADK